MITSKLSVHFFTYIVIFVGLITGLFKELVMFMLLIMIHEMGHIIMAKILKWQIAKVIILPFGALTVFENCLNKPLYQELLIVLMGPLFQLGGYLFLHNLFDYHFTIYNYAILYFNLLPIFPLDGLKLISILLYKVLPFKLSYKCSLYISYFSLIVLIFLIFWIKNFLFLLIGMTLLIGLIKERQLYESTFNKFLLERYLSNLKFKKKKYFSDLLYDNMYRDYTHFFYNGLYYISEHDLLKKRFDFKYKV